MSASDQQILDAARDQLLAVLTAGVAEFGEGGERARMIEVDRLENLIEKYENKIARSSSGSILRPIVTGRGL